MRDNSETLVRLDAGTRAGFISDLHLGPAHPEIAKRLARYLEGPAARLDALFVLGDLFEYWIGDDAADRCGYREAIDSLAAFFGASGCRGYFMHGNRDFLVGDRFCRETGFTLLADPCILEVDGTRLLLSHGDAYCTDDVDHQEFRATVRETGWRRWFLEKDIEERLRFAVEARAVSESGKSRKPLEIMDVNRHAIERVMVDADVRYLIHGHTHRPAVHTLHVGGREAWRIVLGAWFEETSSLVIEKGKIRYAPAGDALTVALEPT